MKILYDYQAFYRDRVGGVSRYFSEILDNMPAGVQTEISAFSTCNLYMTDRIQAHRIECTPQQRWRSKALKVANHLKCIQRLKQGGYDIFHPTDFDTYYLPHVKTPVVATIHDMIWERYHLNTYVEEHRKKQIETADRIICVSHNTRNDLLSIFPHVDERKVCVIYHGINPVAFHPHTPPYGDYVLFVGKREGYKNFHRFLQAMSIVREKRPELNIVCTGMPFTLAEQQTIRDLRLENHIYQTFVDDAELYNLYAHAMLFVFPSEYEGFGIPILEAFHCHCPVAADPRSGSRQSNTSTRPAPREWPTASLT